jgi:glycosyltransferase involved in cell wall biosynthesis
MTNSTLLYIDPGYRIDFGHYMHMGEAIRKEAEASNIELRHYVNIDVPQDTADKSGLIRKFKYTAGLPWEKDPGEALRDFHINLDEIIQDIVNAENRNDLEIFMYTAHPLHLPVIAYTLNKYSGMLKGLSAHVCLFYVNPEFCTGNNRTDEYEKMLARSSNLIESLDPDHLLTICTDSERTARSYGPYFKREFKVLPVPVENVYQLSAKENVVSNERVTIGYIGQTTERAGYHLAYAAYKEISSMDIFDRIRFHIKHTKKDFLHEMHDKFLAESINIRHVNEFLSNEAYEQFLSGCDIVLMPYSRKYYPCQTSGIVTEAILMRKVLIVPEETWMADQIVDYGAGETFVSDNLDSLVQAIVKVADNYKSYKEKTERNLDKFRKIHSCSNLFTKINLKNSESAGKIKSNPEKVDFYSRFDALMMENITLMQEKDKLIRQIKQKNNQIKDRDAQINNKDEQLKNKDEQLQMTLNSLSWKITSPLRKLVKPAIDHLEKQTGKKDQSGRDTKAKTDTVFNPEPHRKRIRSFKGRYKGQRCFVIGNGPSLNKIDMHLLENEYTFAVNSIFYKTDETGFKPAFYMVEDNLVVEDNLERINNLDYDLKFFADDYHKIIKHDKNTIFIPTDLSFYHQSSPFHGRPRFSFECDKVIYAGQTVTYQNLQLAYYMGFETVYLIGMDFSYDVPPKEEMDGTVITSKTDDVSHFHKDYFGKGKRWHDPNLANCKLVYEHAKKVYEENGRKIYNATIGGKLEVFERRDFYDLFPKSKVE